jgi:hypothetical protein
MFEAYGVPNALANLFTHNSSKEKFVANITFLGIRP